MIGWVGPASNENGLEMSSTASAAVGAKVIPSHLLLAVAGLVVALMVFNG